MFEMMHLTISAVTFMNFFCLVPSNWYLFFEKSNFSVYGVYIWKSLKNSFHMYQMQNLLGNDSYKKYAG